MIPCPPFCKARALLTRPFFSDPGVQHYNHVAATNIKARKQAHREWIESHGVDEIRQANNARKMLRRLVPSKFSRLRLLKDDRLPKRPLPVYVSFVRDRWASGDLKHMTIKDVAKLMSTEWKELSASEREVRILFCPHVLLHARSLPPSRDNVSMYTTVSH